MDQLVIHDHALYSRDGISPIPDVLVSYFLHISSPFFTDQYYDDEGRSKCVLPLKSRKQTSHQLKATTSHAQNYYYYYLSTSLHTPSPLIKHLTNALRPFIYHLTTDTGRAWVASSSLLWTCGPELKFQTSNSQDILASKPGMKPMSSLLLNFSPCASFVHASPNEFTLKLLLPIFNPRLHALQFAFLEDANSKCPRFSSCISSFNILSR